MLSAPRVVLVDNFDSFSFNLVESFERLGAQVEVYRNDVDAEQLLKRCEASETPALLVLSPGPGGPTEAGCCLELVRAARGRLAVFGVCLGLQVSLAADGSEVGPAGELVHGRATALRHDGRGVFSGLDSPFVAGRYHSLAVRAVPPGWHVHSSHDGLIMAASNASARACGVQFHPESILSPQGDLLLANALQLARGGCHA